MIVTKIAIRVTSNLLKFLYLLKKPKYDSLVKKAALPVNYTSSYACFRIFTQIEN